MRILIAGGGGYLGSALVKHFAGEHHCICFGHSGRFDELQKAIHGDVEYVAGDVTDAALVQEVMRETDAVICVAGTGGEADCLADPTHSLLTHVHGTQVLMHEAQRQNVANFIFTSTIAVYGTYQSRPMPLTEELEPRPDEFYGALKTTAERGLIDSGRFKILRLSNVYGYGSGLFSLSSGVAGKFIELISQGKPLRVFGDGAQLIDYVHINDVCRAYELALREPEDRNFIFNVGGGKPVAIRNLAESVAQVAEKEIGRRPEIQTAPAPPDKLWPDRWLSISKIETELGWRPATSLEDGIKEMIANWVTEKVKAEAAVL
jgi:UDP-glucose 4-epimerase